MEFSKRLVKLRKERGMNQQALADAVGVHVSQLKRYEYGTSQPTLDVLRNLATALSVSADVLLFGEEGRGPSEEFRLQFEALQQLDDDEKQVAKELLDALILKHQARTWGKRAS